jgi:acyl-CoA thioester hydrolase
MINTHEITIRVRYQETDGQGRVHHANYLKWFEMGRIELLRAAGHSYADLERNGILLVIAEANCQYFLPAEFDDLLTLRTTTVQAKGARIEHEYELYRDEELLVRGRTLVACISKEGRVTRLPKWLLAD